MTPTIDTIPVVSYIGVMEISKKDRAFIAKLTEKPTPNDVRWTKIEGLVKRLGGSTEDRGGSMVWFSLNGRGALFHRPHPKPQTPRPYVRQVVRFLKDAGAIK